MTLFLQILEGDTPATARSVVATRDRKIIASVARAIADRLVGIDSAEVIALASAHDRLYTDGQLARRLRVRAAWLRTEAEANRLPHVRVGDGFMFDVDAVEAALLARARKLPTDPTGNEGEP